MKNRKHGKHCCSKKGVKQMKASKMKQSKGTPQTRNGWK